MTITINLAKILFVIKLKETIQEQKYQMNLEVYLYQRNYILDLWGASILTYDFVLPDHIFPISIFRLTLFKSLIQPKNLNEISVLQDQ